MDRLQNGDVLCGRYRIVETIGQGGMGTVYAAEDLRLQGKKRAVKEIAKHDVHLRLLEEEVRMLIQLNHPLLSNIVDYLSEENRPFAYIIMDYVEGTTLQESTDRSRLTHQKAASYAIQLCDILHYLHSQKPHPVIYRDLKPSNIMIDHQDRVRLIDFGIARHHKTAADSDTVPLGTLGFAAPEQLSGKQTDHRSDLYSLGALLYYILSGGEYLLEGHDLQSLNPDVPDAFVEVIRRLTRDDPEERYQSAGEVKAALEAMHSDELEAVRKGQASSLIKRPHTIVIAFGGAGHRTGCTHASIQAAVYLAERRFHTACVEWESGDNRPVFSVFESDIPAKRLPKGFHFKRVDFYSRSKVEFVDIWKAGYDYIILDMGSLSTERDEKVEKLSEFLRADLHIITSGASLWDFHSLADTVETLCKTHAGQEWQVLINFADDRSWNELRGAYSKKEKKTYRLHFHQNVLNADPFTGTEAQRQAFFHLLRSVLPDRPRKKRFFIF